jgi:glutamate racemase
MDSYIGVYDSGLGGISVAREVRALLPQHNLYYLADTAYCPYGPRSIEEVRERARVCTRWLIEHGAGVVVVACNTATSAALDVLRAEFTVPFVGMEPGIKPAISVTRTRQVGVLATNGTLSSQRFESLVCRFAQGVNVEVQRVPCPELVNQVEAGDMDGPTTRTMLSRCLSPLQQKGVDTIVLGCSHFHFVAPLLSQLVGPTVTIIDTAPAVARQVVRVVGQIALPYGRGAMRCVTTGDIAAVAPILTRLCDSPLSLSHVAL